MANQDVEQLRRTWEQHGQSDPLWAILTEAEKRGGRWDAGAFFATGREEIGALMRTLEAFGAPRRRQRALDFGCGVGRLTEALAEHFPSVDGVDISETMIQRARELSAHPDACRYHVNTRGDLQLFEDATFDLVHSSIVLQHVGRELAASYLTEFVRILRPGGVVHVQLPTTPRWTLGGLVLRVAPAPILDRLRGGMRMEGMPEQRVRALLERGGLTVLQVAPDRSAGDRWHSRRYTAGKPELA
jgi:2-polyprenyl-3-methyl-5-hydroxy-6-metoxy-1,4-benzoquinol methylase